jgi:predicted flap endonuclease-1-like 5' DNA nuclease
MEGTLMSLLTCCFWWFVLGLLLGWLLNWLLSKWLRADPPVAARAPTTPAAPRAGESIAPVMGADQPRASAVAPARVVDVGAARAAGFDLKRSDDLTIIEGIGPKIDELFHASGVNSFAHLARMSAADMQAILDRGGPHFKLANPGTWAHQALLASENRWAELKKLQDELIGGIGPTS